MRLTVKSLNTIKAILSCPDVDIRELRLSDEGVSRNSVKVNSLSPLYIKYRVRYRDLEKQLYYMNLYDAIACGVPFEEMNSEGNAWFDEVFELAAKDYDYDLKNNLLY